MTTNIAIMWPLFSFVKHKMKIKKHIFYFFIFILIIDTIYKLCYDQIQSNSFVQFNDFNV